MSNTLDNQIISQKIHNYNYAPGIATYGIDGKIGKDGESGNNIFYTDYIINSSETQDLNGIAKQIIAQYLPIKNSTTKINRQYVNGDYFFDYNGTIFRLINYNKMSSDINNGGNITNYSEYFEIVGKIKVDNPDYLTMANNRLIIDSSYKGFDIISSQDVSNKINKEATLNIISNNIDENSQIHLLHLNGIDSNSIDDATTTLYYDTLDKSFHLDSNIPLLIDADVKIDSTQQNIETDTYSTILTSHDSITQFKSICDRLSYNITMDEAGNNYMIIYVKDSTSKEEAKTLLQQIVDKGVYAKVYGQNGQQTITLLEKYESNPGAISGIPINNLINSPISNISTGISTNYEITNNSSTFSIKYQPRCQAQFKAKGNEYTFNKKDLLSYYTVDKDNNKTCIARKYAYIYRNESSKNNPINIAVFNDYKIIPIKDKNGNETSQKLTYLEDYVIFKGAISQTVTIESEPSSMEITEYKSTISHNNDIYLEVGVSSYSTMLLNYDKNITIKNTTYDNNMNIYYSVDKKTYYEPGYYVYTFKYKESPEIARIKTEDFGTYKQSKQTTDFLDIIVRTFAPGPNKSYDDNYIYVQHLNLHYVYGNKSLFEEKYEKPESYPQFIDGEEYSLSFSINTEDADYGFKISNLKLTGKLKNNIDTNEAPTFKIQIPDYVGTVGKISLMHNTEIFLS